MKGYTEVTVEKALLALENRNKRKDVALTLEEGAIEDFATKRRKEANWFSRRKLSKLTDGQILFESYKTPWDRRLALKEFLSESGYQIVADFDQNCYREQDQGPKIRHLINASTSGILLLDNELCEFINKFTMVENDD